MRGRPYEDPPGLDIFSMIDFRRREVLLNSIQIAEAMDTAANTFVSLYVQTFLLFFLHRIQNN